MTRSLILPMLLMSGFLLLGALEAAAATRFVRSTDGVDAGNTCLVETSPCQTVQHATDSASAGDEIWLAGDFDESVSTTLPISFVGRSRFVLSIPGGGAGSGFGICEGETGINRCPLWTTSSPSAPALQLNPGALQSARIERIRFADVSGPPAVQLDSGSIQILEVVFRNNVNSSGSFLGGGALSIAGADDATVEHSVFEENRDVDSVSLAGGGAIFSLSPLTVVHSTFTLNEAESGGAVFVANESLSVTDSIFQQNVATDSGGAIAAEFFPVTITDSTFEFNEAESGGAVFVANESLSVTDSIFRQNVATDTGGAIAAEFAFPVTITDSTFEFNEAASQGGAIETLVCSLEITGATLFAENRVDIAPALTNGGGGAVSVAGTTTEIDGATFRANVVEATASEALGAALVASAGSSVTIMNTRFEENADSAAGSAREVGIVAAIGADLDVQSTVFDNAGIGQSGSALVLDGSTLTMQDSQVLDYAGGIFLETLSGIAVPSTVEVLRSTLAAHTKNVAARTGTNVQVHEVRFFNATLSGASATNVDVGEAGLYAFEFTTLANGAAFDFGAFDPTSTLQVDVRDSIVDGACEFGGSSFAGPTLALGTRWSDASCGIGPGLVSSIGLLPLADNGGPTETHALSPTSPAIDAGELRCLATPIDAIDQRGFARPEGACDVGAVEVPEPGFVLGVAVASIGLALRRQRMVPKL